MYFFKKLVYGFVYTFLLVLSYSLSAQDSFPHAKSQVSTPGVFDYFIDPSDYVWLGYAASVASYGSHNTAASDYFLKSGFITDPNNSKPICLNKGWYGYGKVSNQKQGWNVMSNDKEKITVIAFRGTKNFHNIVSDIDFTPHKVRFHNERNVWMHSGFWRNWNSVSNDVKKALQEMPKDHKLIVAGHSLGAAVAQIAAVYMETWDFRPDAVFLFASPLTGNGDFRDAYKAYVGCYSTLRVVVKGDLVNGVPNVYGYTHVCDSVETYSGYSEAGDRHGIDEGFKKIMHILFSPNATHSEKACPVNKIGIYKAANYSGDSIYLPGNTPDLGTFKDNLASFTIPEGWSARFYEKLNLDENGGHYYTRDVSQPTSAGMTRAVKSVRIVSRPNTAILYDGQGQSGNKYHITSDTPNLGSFSGKTISFDIPFGWTLRFFDKPNYQGGFYTRTSGKRTETALRGKVQSVKVLQMSLGVIIYDQKNRKGKSQLLTENSPRIGGDYQYTTVKSIYIPANWRVRIFANSYYGGTFYTREGGKNGLTINDTDIFEDVRAIQILERP